MHEPMVIDEKRKTSARERDPVLRQRRDIEAFIHQLKYLITRHNPIPEEKNIGQHLGMLTRSHTLSESGIAWLAGLRDQLKLAADEIQRLEGEGGIPASREQVEKNEELLKTIRRIENILNAQ